MKFSLLIVSPFFVTFFTLSAVADVNINLQRHQRCDPIYQPANCVPFDGGGDLDFKNELAARTGIGLSRTDTITPLRAQIIRINTRGQIFGSLATNNPAPRQQPDQPTASPEGADSSQPGSGQTQAASAQGSGPAAQASAPGMQVRHAGGGQTIVGGMMYADDDEGPEIQAPGTNTHAATTVPINPTQAALNVNRGLDTGGRSKNSRGGGARGGGAMGGGVNPNQFGQIDSSPTPVASSGSGGGITAQLKAIAAALGIPVGAEGGDSGGGSVVSRYGRGGNLNGQGRGLASAQAGQGQGNAPSARLRNLLKDRYGRYISSVKGAEFSAAETEVFKGMCGHYAAYAAKHRIPYDRVGCDVDPE